MTSTLKNKTDESLINQFQTYLKMLEISPSDALIVELNRLIEELEARGYEMAVS